METKHLTQQNFADLLHISPASLSSIFNDRTKPTLNHVDAIVKGFPNVNLQWLLYGEGKMFQDADAAKGQDSSPSNADTGFANSPTESSLMFDFSEGSSVPSQTYNSPEYSRPARGNGFVQEREVVKYVDKPQRQITEIRIFFDDQTWETFVPKK